MRITVTLEVESREALATILRTGAKQSLYDYRVIEFRNGPTPAPAGLSMTCAEKWSAYRRLPEIRPPRLDFRVFCAMLEYQHKGANNHEPPAIRRV